MVNILPIQRYKSQSSLIFSIKFFSSFLEPSTYILYLEDDDDEEGGPPPPLPPPDSASAPPPPPTPPPPAEANNEPEVSTSVIS